MIRDLVDFSFIYDELNGKYCQDNGRMAEDPVSHKGQDGCR